MESKRIDIIPMSNLNRYKAKVKTKIDYNPMEFDFKLKTFKLIIINSFGQVD